MREGIALVLSAPSGAGKSTLCKRLRQEFPNLGFSVSCATRAPREGEVDGKDYCFVSEAEFRKMRDAGQFAEWAEVHGHFYGTPLAPVRAMLKAGADVLFDVDVRGAAQLKAVMPDAVFVFILPPDMAELRRRLAQRGTEDAAAINMRLANAARELREAFWYDAIIVNDDLDHAYRDLAAVYRAATLAASKNRRFLEKLLESCAEM